MNPRCWNLMEINLPFYTTTGFGRNQTQQEISWKRLQTEFESNYRLCINLEYDFPHEKANMIFSSVVSNPLQAHGLQHASLPCPLPTPRACLNSCPLSRWCHPTISSSVVPFSSCLQSFPASESFLRGQFFTSGGQSIRDSASASVLTMNIQDWFPLGLTGLILQSKRLSRVFSKTAIQEHQFFGVFSWAPKSMRMVTTWFSVTLIKVFFKKWGS